MHWNALNWIEMYWNASTIQMHWNTLACIALHSKILFPLIYTRTYCNEFRWCQWEIYRRNNFTETSRARSKRHLSKVETPSSITVVWHCWTYSLVLAKARGLCHDCCFSMVDVPGSLWVSKRIPCVFYYLYVFVYDSLLGKCFVSMGTRMSTINTWTFVFHTRKVIPRPRPPEVCIPV